MLYAGSQFVVADTPVLLEFGQDLYVDVVERVGVLSCRFCPRPARAISVPVGTGLQLFVLTVFFARTVSTSLENV